MSIVIDKFINHLKEKCQKKLVKLISIIYFLTKSVQNIIISLYAQYNNVLMRNESKCILRHNKRPLYNVVERILEK